MAKKAGKASAKKAGKKAGAKGGGGGKKKSGAKAGASTAPKAVKTGAGATPAEIGASLVELFNQGKFDEIEKKWWSAGIVSIEGMGVAQAWHGRKAVEAKNQWWYSTHEMLGGRAEGPYVGATGFAVKFTMEVRERATGKQWTMDEVGVYSVLKGKIVQEEFMYGNRQ